MRSSFFEFNVAVSGLMTARAGLATTSHNVANASTPGYSRQYIDQRASTPLTFYDGRGMVGTGSTVEGIYQVRSFYLDKKYWNNMATYGQYGTKYTELSLVETIMNNLSGIGLNGAFDEFFTSLSSLSIETPDGTYRNNVLTSAKSLTEFVQSTAQSLYQQQKDINSNVATMVERINSLGSQITALNKQIYLYEQNGSMANDLRDQRATIIDELSLYVNVDVREVDYSDAQDGSDMRMIIQLNGYDFIKHFDYESIRVEARDYLKNPTDADGLYDIIIGKSTNFNLYSSTLSGELKGLIDVRDGNSNNYLSGEVVAVNDTGAVGEPNVVIKDVSRTDLPSQGIVYIDGVAYQYINYTYSDPSVGGSGEITFTLDPSYPTGSIAGSPGDAVISNQTNEFKGIPYYLDKLNELVRTFAKAVNEGLDKNNDPIDGMTGHVQGYNEIGSTTQNNYLFFTNDSDTFSRSTSGVPTGGWVNYYNNFNAFNFTVSDELMDNVDQLNLYKDYTPDNDTAGESDNSLVHALINLKDNQSLFREGKLGDYIISISSQLGIDIQHATQFAENYYEITETIDNQRIQVSGVSLNEEIINMIKYNQIYQAAAKLMNIIDGIYDTTIRMGAF